MKKFVFLLFISVIITVTGCGSPNANNNGISNANVEGRESQNATNAANDAGETARQELIVAGQEIPVSLDPVQPLTTAYLRNIGAAEALFKVNAEGEAEPELAESAQEISPTVWEIKLRENGRFWSGKEIDAASVIASLERSRELDLQAQPFLEGLAFSALDERTLRVETAREHASVPLNLSYYQTSIHNVELAHESVETMDMTGMYKVVGFIPKQKMTLEANGLHWGPKPGISRIVYEEIADEQTRVLSVLSGRSHLALNISPSSLPRFEENDKAAISAAPAANTQTIYLNLNQPQFGDVRVRQALSWGLDRDELNLLGAEGQSTPVTTWLGSNPAYAEAKNAVYGKSDPDKAGQLLDEAGWLMGNDGIRYKDGDPLTVRLMTWGGEKALGEALQSQWSALGVKAEVRHGDYSLIETARETGDWDATIEAWSTFGDEYALLAGQYAAEGRGNYGGLKDAQIGEWLEELAAASDPAARRELALRINERAAELAPVISLFPRPQLTAVSKSLQGYREHFRQFENAINANMALVAE